MKNNVFSLFQKRQQGAIPALLTQNLIIEELKAALEKERFENKKLIEENDRLNGLLNAKEDKTK